jgi:hypothetical protein
MNSANTKMSENRGYSRGDGKGVVLLVDAKTVDEARAVMETLPLAKEPLLDHEYIPVGRRLFSLTAHSELIQPFCSSLCSDG